MFDLDAWGRPTGRRRPDLEEPEWDATERAWMLALAYVEDHECPGCKGWMPETTDPSSDPDNAEGTHRYKTGLPSRCHRCTSIAQRREQYKDSPHDHALFFAAERVPRRPSR